MQGKATLLVLGNVITMDEHKPRAEAVAIQGDKILYVGAAEVAKKLCDDNTKVIDYGKNSIYPGFLEAHCHPGGAGLKMTAIAQLDRNASLEECVQEMKKYMEAHPEKEIIQGLGFEEHDVAPKAYMLDEICPDKVMVVSDSGGHSAWMNTKAMEFYGINKDAVEKWGTACIRVDENGNPTGYISEGPVFEIRTKMPYKLEDLKTAISAWQDYALSMGYTGVYNAGVELMSALESEAYHALEEEGKLKHYNFSGSLIKDNTDTPEEDIERIAKEAKERNSKHYKLLGAKVFCDGVVEGHTAWVIDEYIDQPGYHGVSRFDDHEKMVRLLKAASKHGLNAHIHTIGDAAVKAWVDAIAEAEEETGDFDRRFALAHLQVVRPEDIRRIGEYNIVAVAGMMWVMKTYTEFETMVKYLGEDKAYGGQLVKSFQDQGAVLVSHSDYPVSPSFSVPWAVCLGSLGYQPSMGEEMLRHPQENLSRIDTLKALTTNVAYSWHEEDRMGSLEVGKLANLAVFDKDFLLDSFEDIENAKCLATFVDGEQVYEA